MLKLPASVCYRTESRRAYNKKIYFRPIRITLKVNVNAVAAVHIVAASDESAAQT